MKSQNDQGYVVANPMDRRGFLKLAGLAVIGGAVAAAAWPSKKPGSQSVSFSSGLHLADETRLIMGTYATITVLDPSKDKAQEALGKAFDLMHQKSIMLSRHRPDGAVAVLNANGGLDGSPPELIDLIQASFKINFLTSGNFDITVAPAVDLLKNSFAANNKPPTMAEVEEVRGLIGMDSIKVEGDKIRLNKSGSRITLDGIAKGHIVDETLKYLAQRGVKHALVNAGGDMAMFGGREDGKPWRVGIADPKAQHSSKTVITMTQGAITTSGNYAIFFDKEKLYHHIIDPRTALSPHGDSSVSALARTAREADGLSTAAFVMGPKKGLDFLERYPDVEGLIITREGNIFKTKKWPA
ncbi:MAG: FAD:protein FMN transferase [Deltaproteobacteria bacterium]|nr:FAD:protein FMN transferase [Deltaproteobacteria bacterium]